MNKKLTAILIATWIIAMALSVTAATFNYISGVRYSKALAEMDGPEAADFRKIATVYNTLVNNYYIAPEPDRLIEGAVSGMLDAVNDPYTFYYNADAWSNVLSNAEGNYAGIGVQVIEKPETGALMVTRCFRDSPAYAAGLRSGDEIIGVDGYSVDGALNGLPAGAAENAPSNRNELIDYMRGSAGSQITLTIKRGAETFDCALIREQIHMNRVEYCMLDAQTGYMAIYEFQGDAADDVKRALDYFEQHGARALAVDLRNNPGGDLNVITSIAEMLLPKGMYAYMEDRQGVRREFSSDGEGWGKPMAVLINGYSASASELFAGAAQDMGAAVIVGQTSYGKGIVQNVIGFGDGSGYQYTVARYFTPSGRVIQGNGIEPDIYVEPLAACGADELNGFAAAGGDWRSKDVQLLKAYDALAHMLDDGAERAA